MDTLHSSSIFKYLPFDLKNKCISYIPRDNISCEELQEKKSQLKNTPVSYFIGMFNSDIYAKGRVFHVKKHDKLNSQLFWLHPKHGFVNVSSIYKSSTIHFFQRM